MCHATSSCRTLNSSKRTHGPDPDFPSLAFPDTLFSQPWVTVHTARVGTDHNEKQQTSRSEGTKSQWFKLFMPRVGGLGTPRVRVFSFHSGKFPSRYCNANSHFCSHSLLRSLSSTASRQVLDGQTDFRPTRSLQNAEQRQVHDP